MFAPREVEADSRDFVNTLRVYHRAFSADVAHSKISAIVSGEGGCMNIGSVLNRLSPVLADKLWIHMDSILTMTVIVLTMTNTDGRPSSQVNN